jgi:serine kinase of HPr protein (carbohydrate metabolism regulator)
MSPEERMHATAIAVGEDGVLLRGDSGAGKSDLALRLVLGPPLAAAGGRAIALVADDQVLVETRGGCLVARAPGVLSGWIEARGLGIVEIPCRAEATLALVVDLVPREDVERLPEDRERCTIGGIGISRVALHAFDPSAALKVILALDMAAGRRRSS